MADLNFAINYKGNTKTGLIPLTTSDNKTCPDVCPLKEKGCYAKYSFLGSYWKKLSNGDVKNSTSFDGLLEAIKRLPKGQLWRHNQAGDLVGYRNLIAHESLDKLIKANKGKKGFTYTHYPMLYKGNQEAVKKANENGFTINLSSNNLEEADQYKGLEIAPVVTLLPIDSEKVNYTPKGNKVVTCPASYNEKITCANCGLCQLVDRDYIIGFPSHGTAKKHIEKNIIAKG